MGITDSKRAGLIHGTAWRGRRGEQHVGGSRREDRDLY